MTTVLNLLKINDYKWIRVSYKNLFQKLGFSKSILTGRVKKFNNLVVLENHYNGFDQLIVNEILNSNREYYIISAHPLMLSFPYKVESKENFEKFINQILNSNQDIQFILPKDILQNSLIRIQINDFSEIRSFNEIIKSDKTTLITSEFPPEFDKIGSHSCILVKTLN